MKKWFLLCAITLFVAHAQQEMQSPDDVTDLVEDLEEIISPKDNDTLGGLIDVVDDEQEEIIESNAQLATELDEAIGQEMQAFDEDSAADEEVATLVDDMEVEDDDIVTGFLRADEKPTIAAPLQQDNGYSYDIEQKRKEVLDLVKRATKELQSNPLDVACNRFTHTKEFIKGDLYVFVYDARGICFAHGEDSHLLWKNLYDLKDWVGTPVIQNLIKMAKEGGGWVTYGWHNATKVSYVELVEKEGIPYVVGSGFYPQSKQEAVVNLVKGGVALFDRVKKEGKPADWAFSRMSYPTGSFAVGNLYLYALDFNGTIMAQGERPGLIGSNAWDYKDKNGVYVNREIVKKLQLSTQGVWVDYTSKRALKRAYAEKVKSKDGKEYFIACGYYPEADRERTVDLVRKAYQFMKINGKTNSVEEFSQRRSDAFRYGDLFIVVYDLQGRIIADGGNADNIGQNMLDAKDEDDFEYVKSTLKRATKTGVWINAKIKGSFRSTFAQRIDLGVGQYVITSSYYPVSKSETMILLVQSAVSYLKANNRERAFEQFVSPGGQFRRGDLEIVAVDTAGLCYAYGDDYDLIWRNIFNIKDEKGRPFIQEFINRSQQGSVTVTTHMNNAVKKNFVMSVEKDGKTYVLSSGYYE